MSDRHDVYQTPLGRRYAGEKMQAIFSDDTKFTLWRRLWIALAESEKELGLDITDRQIEELKSKSSAGDIDYKRVAEHERRVRHDVMAHVLAYGEQCPTAKPIIHLGATSCYVGDNTDIIQMRDALLHIKRLLVTAAASLAGFAKKHAGVPTLAFTHFQAAQPTTVGKRASLWLQDLLIDIDEINARLNSIKLLGCKGTTGTAASFLTLFNGDHGKVKRLDSLIAEKMGFSGVYPVSGQTYTRKLDAQILAALSGIAQSAHKFSNDIRLLSHLKEADEPFEDSQIGSSAMAYKRNPMRSERIASLARYVICGALNPAFTAASQWLERTLDDSANKRIAIPEAFLATDAILSLYINIIGGLTVYPGIMERHLREELPFMATESILMYCVTEKGGDRQALHEAIREHSVQAAKTVKIHGGNNDLLERILRDPAFNLTAAELDTLLDADKFTGRARQQTEEFLYEYARPALSAEADFIGADIDIKV